jgi:hypothetical protein
VGRALANDPNWLLSTTAMSAAALVAIVGGFLISRVVALVTESHGLDRRILELTRRLDLKRYQLGEVTTERQAVCEDWFDDAHLKEYIATRGEDESLVDRSLRDWLPRGSTSKEMQPYAESLRERVSRAFSAIEAAYNGPKFPPADVDELRNDGVRFEAIDEKIFVRVAAAIAESRRPRSMLPELNVASLGITRSELPIARQDARIDQERSLAAEVAALDAEKAIGLEARRGLTRPRELWMAVAVLAYFALIGTVFPLILMAFDPVPHSQSVRVAVVAGFASGLVALIGFVAWAICQLRLTDNPG